MALKGMVEQQQTVTDDGNVTPTGRCQDSIQILTTSRSEDFESDITGRRIQPVKREEVRVRFDLKRRLVEVSAAPLSALEGCNERSSPNVIQHACMRPIHDLWADLNAELLAELHKLLAKREAVQEARRRDREKARKADPDAAARHDQMIAALSGMFRSTPTEAGPAAEPRVVYPFYWSYHFKRCVECRKTYLTAYESGLRLYCSDACAAPITEAMRVKSNEKRRAARAEKRSGLTCVNCASSFTTHRSHSKYCSTRCRVAFHRSKVV